MGDEKLVGQLADDGALSVLPLKGKEPTLFIWSMSGQLSWECVLAKKGIDQRGVPWALEHYWLRKVGK